MSSHYLADPLHEADDDEQDSDYDPELDPEYVEDDDNDNEELEAAESLVNQLDPSLFSSRSGISILDLLRLVQGSNGASRTGSIPRMRYSRSSEEEEPDVPLFSPTTTPQDAGLGLLYGGDFGGLSFKRDTASQRPSIAHALRTLHSSSRRPFGKEVLARDALPNSRGSVVASYIASVYSGQYSRDSSFYYTCCRDFKLHVYDTTAAIGRKIQKYDDHLTTMNLIKTVRASSDQSWTITDSDLSPDNERMIWASVTPIVYMTSTTGTDSTQIPVNFGDPDGRRRGGLGQWYDPCSIWSCRFSADGNEIVAGGVGGIFVYDLVANRRTVKIQAHQDDVNSCCWADAGSGNVLVSASDDTFLKVWDRRSLGSHQTPSGVLIGHTEGITYVSPKGDGRYLISNGKDQVLRLWDLRMMRSNKEYESVRSRNYGTGFDYRTESYRRARYPAHPLDCSVTKYHGHSVLRTLIRCHFSPIETTGQQYIYSGSADGRIHIWSLDGRVVEVLDRKQTLPLSFHPSDAERVGNLPERLAPVCVRDVSWHSQEPVLMSAGWDGYYSRGGSSIARHEWKGLFKQGGLTVRNALEDFVERRETERRERRTSAED